MKYAIIAIILVGCTSLNRAGFADGDAGDDVLEDEIGVDVEDDVLEDLAEETPTEVWEEPLEDPDEDPVEDPGADEAPCGAPTDDCDDDGVTPAGGDCCDDNDQVNPAQDGWFAVPYYCTDESWDYNCDGEEEYEYHPTVSAPIDCEDYTSRSSCEAVSGWYGSMPACGTVGRFVDCAWSTYSWVCYPVDEYEGLVRCR